jgi:hypothetical protein
MKTQLAITSLCVVLALASCKKDETSGTSIDPASAMTAHSAPVTRAYNDSFGAFSNLTFTSSGVFNPGSGSGNATHMGNASCYFNQLVLFYNGNPIGSVAAPVSQFFSSQIAAAGITGVPGSVSTITIDHQGNSIWFTTYSGTSLAFVNPTRVNFSSNLSIIGGTGKFAGATGTVTLNGYFNPQSPSQAATFINSGTITF